MRRFTFVFLLIALAPPDPRSLHPALSDDLADVILRCLAKDPAQRYPDATALGQALRQLR